MTGNPRAAVAQALAKAERAGHAVVIACSGGPDSLALVHLAAVAHQRRTAQVTVAIVDHQLQLDSEAVALAAVEHCYKLGITSVAVLSVEVTVRGEGLEAAARAARRHALQEHAAAIGAAEIWLGHTLEDQAETVLIGLTHGSGSRSLQGMAIRELPWVRPLLHCRRANVRSTLPPSVSAWEDPHNTDPQFLRARVRAELLPHLVDVLGDRAIVNLARTAELLRLDNAALDEQAAQVWAAGSDERGATDNSREQDGALAACSRTTLESLPEAVRNRVIRLLLLHAGANARELTSAHIRTVARLALESDVLGPIALPGGVHAVREHDRVVVRPAAL